MSQTSHRKSFVKGILQVAAGEESLPASELEEGKRLPHYVLRVEPYSWEDRYNRPLPDPDSYYRNEVSFNTTVPLIISYHCPLLHKAVQIYAHEDIFFKPELQPLCQFFSSSYQQ